MVKKINKVDGIISPEELNSFGNISKIKSSLSNESFEDLINSFGEKKSEAIDLISIVLSKDKTKLSDLGELSINIDKILSYDERDFLDSNIQKAITTLFIKKIVDIAKDDEKIREIFEANLGEISKIEDHKYLVKDLKIQIFELWEIFPDIAKNIRINNVEIWQELNKLGFAINSISSFEKQNLSDQKIICELLFWQNKEAISNYGNFENSIEAEIKDTNIGLEFLEKNKIDDEYLEKIRTRDKADEEGDIETVDKINKELWKKKIDNMKQNGENPKKIKILEKLVGNNFDFGDLSDVEQNIFVKEYSQKFLGKLKENKFLKLLNIDTDQYETFWDELLDFQKKEHQLEIHLLDGRDIKLNVKKYFEKGEQRKFLDSEKFEDLGMIFDINIDDNNDEIINLLESKENVLMSGETNRSGMIYSYTSKNGELRIGDDYDLNLEGVKLNMSQMSEFFEKDEDELKNILVEYGLWGSIKNIFEEVIKNKTIMNKIKNQETCIFTEMLKKMDLQVLSRNIKLDAKNINKLSDLFVFGTADQENLKKANSQELPSNIKSFLNANRGDTENIKKVAQEILDQLEYDAYEEDPYVNFDDIKTEYDKLTNSDKESLEREIRELIDQSSDENVKNLGEELLNHLHGSETNKLQEDGTEETGVKEELETEEEKFLKAREELSGYDFEGAEDKGFRVGTRLFINGGGSELPPKDKDDSFFEFEISDISEHSFQVKVIGNEQKGDQTGKKFWLPKTQEHLDKMKGSGEIFKVAKLQNNDRDNSINNIIKSKFFDKMTVFGEQEGQVKLKNGKIVNKDGEEIKHFGRSVDIWDGEGKRASQKKEHTTYEIKGINQAKGTMRVVCDFEGQDENDLSKFINYRYDKELTFEQFILLMEAKKLRGYSAEEQKKRSESQEMDKYRNNKKIKFFSLANIIGGFKTGFKKINELSKKISEEQQEDFENLLYSKEGLDLYGKIGGLLSGFGLFPDTAEAFDRAQLEFYNDRQNRVWKKIEFWYKAYESDPHFATLWGDQLEKLLITPGYAGNDKNKHKVAAAFLILIKKDGPYGRGGLVQYMGKGFWVEKFLGPEHKTRFEKIQAERKRQLEEYKDINNPHRRKTRQDELNRLEFDYIVGVIDGRAPFLEKDEHMRANHVWSRKFAEQLDENSKGYFSSFKKRSEEVGQVSFRHAEQEYFRMLTAGRVHKALPYLKRIMDDAQSKTEQSRAKMYFLGAMLTGIIKNGQNNETMTEFWTTARTMGLLPGIWCRDTDQADKVQILLDGITSQAPFENFSQATKYKKSDFELGTFSPSQKNMDFLAKDLPNYRKKYGDKLLDILEFKNMESSNSIIDLAEKGDENSYIFKNIIELSREGTKEDINKNVSYTYSYYTNSPWTANKGVVDGLVPRNGEYKGKETIEIEASQEFWKAVGQNFNTGKLAKKGVIEFYIGKFKNRFDNDARDQSSVNFMMRGLALVKKLKQEGKHDEAKYNLWYLIKGNLHEKIGSFPPEFGIVVDKFLDFFDNNIDMIDDNMIKSTFGTEAAISFKDPYGMLNWKNFYDKYMAYEGFGGSKEKTQYQKTFKRNEENYINWKIDNISKNLKRKGISGQPIVINYSEQEVEHKSGLKSRIIA